MEWPLAQGWSNVSQIWRSWEWNQHSSISSFPSIKRCMSLSFMFLVFNACSINFHKLFFLLWNNRLLVFGPRHRNYFFSSLMPWVRSVILCFLELLTSLEHRFLFFGKMKDKRPWMTCLFLPFIGCVILVFSLMILTSGFSSMGL